MLKFGIIGCGAIANAHVDAIASIPDAQLVACCDIDQAKLQDFAARHAGLRTYLNYCDLLASDVDVVTIATPHYRHAEMTIAALAANKHVICEKPMAKTVSETDAVLAAAQASRGTYTVCFQNRFNPSFITFKQLLAQGELGQLKGVKCELTWHRDAAYYQAADWKGRWATEGGGVLINQAIHTLDALCWLCGQPRRVKGRIMTSLLDGAVEVEDAAMATVALPHQVNAVVFATNDYSSDPDPVMTFDGTKGTARLTMHALHINNQLIEDHVDDVVAGKKAVWGDGHRRLFRAFVNRIEGIDDPLIKYLPQADGREALALLTGIYQSSASGNWIELAH